MKSQEEILRKTEAFVEEQLAGEASGHDWWHIVRVRNMAQRLAVEEGADIFICQLTALFHDVADQKIACTEEAGLQTVREWLELQELSENDCRDFGQYSKTVF